MQATADIGSIKKRKIKDGPDFAAVGPEHDNHFGAWRDAMDWARIELDYQTLKDSFCEWARVNRDIDEQPHWKALAPWQYMTLGRMTFCMLHGATPPDEAINWMDAKIADLLAVAGNIEPDSEPERKLSAHQRKIVEYVNLYSHIEAVCARYRTQPDEITSRIKKMLSRVQPNQQMLKKLYEHFKDSFDGAMVDKENPLVAETLESLITVVNILATSTGNAKAIRESRGATTKSIKAASKAKFKAVDMTTDIASLSPAMIPGSQTVIIYNSKNRKVSSYVAAAGDVLGIKGTKITGYDEALSFAKTLRKPKQTLAALRDATTVKRVDIIMGDYIKGKRHKTNGKLNKDTLVLRVFK